LFIHTNHRFLPIIGSMIHFKNVFHRRYKGRVLFRRYTPALLQMRLIRVFFNIFSTVGADICSTMPGSTARLPRSRKVHRLYPAGGFPQHRAMIFASTSLVTIGGTGGVCRTFRFNTRSIPSCSYCLLTRYTKAT
jgi:hypothetical protein